MSEDYDPAEETSPELVPILFDPFLEVDDTADDLVPGDAPWFELKEHYDSTNEIIGYWSGQFPAIYALIRDGLGSGAIMDNLSVEAEEQALSTIEQSLRQVLADIAAAEALQLDPLDLKPIHKGSTREATAST